MLDQVPAWLRHLLIAVAVPVLTIISSAVEEGGIDDIDWSAVGDTAVAALVTYLLLVLTPATRQYGVGAPPPSLEV